MWLEWFWMILAAACVVWYSTITFLVAYKGVHDIRDMLGRLAKNGEEQDS